jgi:hypothetical protein
MDRVLVEVTGSMGYNGRWMAEVEMSIIIHNSVTREGKYCDRAECRNYAIIIF